MQKIPTTVFSGFLGSGKTTIISHLVEELQQSGEQVVYIKNEIGDENIDGQILAGKQIQTRQLLNGCICCTLVGPFISAIDEVIETAKPTRIIIEASGAADPAAIALMIDSHPKLQRDGVISVIDVVNFDGYKDLSFTAQNQTKFTDLLVFNKVELADDKRKEAVVGYVRELNNHSPVVEAPRGYLQAAVAFGLSDRQLTSLLENEKQGQTHDHHHDHLSEDGIETFHLERSEAVEVTAIKTFLGQLPSSVYRVKGFATLVNEEKVLINKAGVRLDITPLENEFAQTGVSLVLIGFHIARLKEQIIKQWQQL